jgi:hypothetical protein
LLTLGWCTHRSPHRHRNIPPNAALTGKGYLLAVNGRSLAEDEPHTVVNARNEQYYAEADVAQSTEGAMKMLFLASVACLVFSLSSGAQAQKAKFSDQHCVPYCANLCARPQYAAIPKQKCLSKCLPMCRELGH